MISQAQGQITSMRVLPSEGSGLCIESSFQATGSLLGKDVTEVGTYVASLTPAGVFHGEGQGMFTTRDGEIITWTGQGVGKPKGSGQAASWRGALYLQTQAQRLAQLNSMALVFEYEVDESGKVQGKLWEWK
ncbi:MAG: hypothetical protein PHX38_02030 [Sulfuricella sp.]|nr:hypothetical protein [Sulfuricella sp.]